MCIMSVPLLQAYLIYSSSVAAGAQSGIEECKYQFAWDRWNCPERALQLSTHSSLRSGKRPQTLWKTSRTSFIISVEEVNRLVCV